MYRNRAPSGTKNRGPWEVVLPLLSQNLLTKLTIGPLHPRRRRACLSMCGLHPLAAQTFHSSPMATTPLEVSAPLPSSPSARHRVRLLATPTCLALLRPLLRLARVLRVLRNNRTSNPRRHSMIGIKTRHNREARRLLTQASALQCVVAARRAPASRAATANKRTWVARSGMPESLLGEAVNRQRWRVQTPALVESWEDGAVDRLS